MKGLFNNVFEGKTVLVTGHTGFKGSWLSIWLGEMGSEVIGYALEPYTADDNFVASGLKNRLKHNIGDIRDYARLKRVFDKYKPEIVFHMAAQPLVRLSYREPRLTYETNVLGTVNMLECCRLSESVKTVINITSDKCYENREWVWGYREDDRMGGHDPYSSSKGCAEIITAAYNRSFFNVPGRSAPLINLASARAGNVIGGGDWREDRLMPDCIRALKKGEAIKVRSPGSVRPWQFVLEPLRGYLTLAAKMHEDGEKYAGAWNFGPDHGSVVTVEELVSTVISEWGSGKYRDMSGKQNQEPHESRSLVLDITKSRRMLGWRPALALGQAVAYTVGWYKEKRAGYEFCASQIRNYCQKVAGGRGRH